MVPKVGRKASLIRRWKKRQRSLQRQGNERQINQILWVCKAKFRSRSQSEKVKRNGQKKKQILGCQKESRKRWTTTRTQIPWVQQGTGRSSQKLKSRKVSEKSLSISELSGGHQEKQGPYRYEKQSQFCSNYKAEKGVIVSGESKENIVVRG